MKKTLITAALSLGFAVASSAATYDLNLAELNADNGSHTLTAEDGSATTVGMGGYGNFTVTMVLNVDEFVAAITGNETVNLYTGNSMIGIGISGGGLAGSWKSDTSFSQSLGSSLTDLSSFVANDLASVALTYTMDGTGAHAYLTGVVNDEEGTVINLSGTNSALKASKHDPLSSFTYEAGYVEYFVAQNPTVLNSNYNLTAIADAAAANVPEPTTATLSLLALAGLAARRRRK